MKRRELIQKLEELGCVLSRHGGRHDWYTNPTTREVENLEVMFFSTRLLRSGLFELPVTADLRLAAP